MSSFAFYPLIDIPLIVSITLGFVINFRIWSRTGPEELRPMLQTNLFMAIVRVAGFFAAILLFCWLVNIAVWVLFTFCVAVGIAGAIFAGDAFGIDLAFFLTGGIIREWCFGFPQLVLRPQVSDVFAHEAKTNEWVGKSGVTISILRPSGKIIVDGKEFLAASEGGTLVEKGVDVIVVGFTNGSLIVKSRE